MTRPSSARSSGFPMSELHQLLVTDTGSFEPVGAPWVAAFGAGLYWGQALLSAGLNRIAASPQERAPLQAAVGGHVGRRLMMSVCDMQSALRMVQQHLAGPLGATARLILICGPEDSVGFEYRGTPVSIWFEREIIAGRSPRWVKVSVGPCLRLYHGPQGYLLAEAGALGLQGSLLYPKSDEEIVEILQAARSCLRDTLWRRAPKSPLLNNPQDALKLVQAELTDPLGAKATVDGEDPCTVVFKHRKDRLFVQFPRALAVGIVPDFVRVGIEWGVYLRSSPDGFAFVHESALKPSDDITHHVREFGDVLEALRGARAALEANHIERKAVRSKAYAVESEPNRVEVIPKRIPRSSRPLRVLGSSRNVRLWRCTEEDSTFISLPEVVRYMREELSLNQDHPLSWEEMVERTREHDLGLAVDAAQQEDENLILAIWMLASLWFAEKYPGSREQASDFGMVVVEIACQDVASLGDFSESILRAHDVAHAAIAREDGRGASSQAKARAVIDSLAQHFAFPAGRQKGMGVVSPLRRALVGIADGIRRWTWPHGRRQK